ncbi:MAG: Do family serine endopeptidase [Nitrospirae bacterium]|nr:Do family serine endopeptidase [Nitrospirota bacterium]
MMNRTEKMLRIPVVLLAFLVQTAFWGTVPAIAKENVKSYALIEDLQNFFVDVAERAQPAVVNISPPSPTTSEGVPLDGPSGQHKASGSGVIIDPTGLIVTNNHVVGSYDEVDVLLSDLRKYQGKVIGRDADTDLALVRIEAKEKLPVVQWADTSKVKVGQWVIAVGNPFGLDRTVTVGIVSGLGREDVNLSRYENFIQTDASINPGNSGGPLLNIRGEMIGINTAIINFAQGIGFAIPADMAQYVVEQILSHGKVARGWLGVGIQPLTQQLARKFDIKDGRGVLVSEVFEGGPAANAGIQAGDVIVKVDEKEMLTPNTLSRVIGTMPPQKKVHLDVIREGRKKEVEIQLGERESEKEEAPSVSLSSTEKPAVDIGIEVRNVTQDLKEKYSLDRAEGVVVTRVESGSLADREGLRSGDLIVEIDRETIDGVESFNKEIGKLQKGGSSLLRVMRDNRAFYLVLSLSN